MPMYCSICTGHLEKTPPDDPTALPGAGALPCGHVFHEFCIQKWLSGSAEALKLCPMCRKAVPGGKCLALFPDIQDPTILEDSISPTRCNHLIEIFSLQNKLSEAKSEASTKANQLLALEDELEDQRYINDDLTEEVEALKEELAALNSLKAALDAVKASGSYQDTYNWPVDEFSIQQLKGHKQQLVSDLKAAEKKQSELLEKLWAAAQDKVALNSKLQAALNEKTVLKKDLTKAHKEKMDVAEKLTRTFYLLNYWQNACDELHNKIKRLELEKAADQSVLNVKPLPKTKPATTTAAKTSKSTSALPPQTRKGKNATMPAALADPPKPPTVPTATKTNANRKSYATRSKTRIQANA